MLKESLSPVFHGFSFTRTSICEDMASSLFIISEVRAFVVSEKPFIVGKREVRWLLILLSDRAWKNEDLKVSLLQQKVQMRADLIPDYAESIVDIFNFAPFLKVLQ